MPTAKSYQNLKLLSEPFDRNNKMYIVVETKSGSPKEVRWYSNLEYAKMYPEESHMVVNTDPYYKPQKYVLGFDKGYITIFKGINEDNEGYFLDLAVFRFAKYWGWYVISTEEVPADLPLGVEPVKLFWDPMGREDGWLKDEAAVKAHVQNTLLGSNAPAGATSKPQGSIGQRLELTLDIIAKEEIENKQYNNTTYIYTMEDAAGNRYEWKTAARNWDMDTQHHIRGTVKEYKGTSDYTITVLTRCAEQ